MHKSKIKIAKIVILSIALFLIAFNIASAAPSWWPIVPCGTSVNPEPCNPCEIFHLGRNIIDFVLLGLMPPVAAGLFIWGGFLILMGGPKPDLFAKGKQIFTTTFYGVLIILGSWLITNTILMSVAQDSIEITKADGTTETVNIVTDWNKFKCTYTGTAPTEPESDTLTISPDTLPDVVINHYYSQRLSVSGGQGPYSWPIEGSTTENLPSGFTFDEGEIRGTATENDLGPYEFTVKVEDSTTPTKLSATKEYLLRVLSTAQSITITTTSLPDGAINTAYPTFTLQANGGITPYSWVLQGGVLPVGLKMSNAGVITGTPTAAGTATLVIKVEDGSSPKLSATKTFTLKIGTTTACDGQSLAQKYGVPYPRKNAPELDTLISCVNSKLSRMIDQNQIYTYERTNDLCNYTRGERVCGSCAHKVRSCHYGGSNGAQGALGVDFNAKAPYTETQLNTELQKLETTCNFGYIEFGTDHTHISSQGCSGN
ncbi:MAG: hypothetical protein A3B00_00700 [Candidatus Yanofskybacteria bacterium RIFCSPLOWO2_01_FULL_41_33]|nr:MAG: hypothetical protein A3B00_00700 [Candidatus Yanofskybacteria bacterium RIFCSPLOWO2_01_FULL_41_33]